MARSTTDDARLAEAFSSVDLLVRLTDALARSECETARLKREIQLQHLKMVERVEGLARVRTEPEDGERKREHGKEAS